MNHSTPTVNGTWGSPQQLACHLDAIEYGRAEGTILWLSLNKQRTECPHFVTRTQALPSNFTHPMMAVNVEKLR